MMRSLLAIVGVATAMSFTIKVEFRAVEGTAHQPWEGRQEVIDVRSLTNPSGLNDVLQRTRVRGRVYAFQLGQNEFESINELLPILNTVAGQPGGQAVILAGPPVVIVVEPERAGSGAEEGGGKGGGGGGDGGGSDGGRSLSISTFLRSRYIHVPSITRIDDHIIERKRHQAMRGFRQWLASKHAHRKQGKRRSPPAHPAHPFESIRCQHPSNHAIRSTSQ